jgi:hypothetical protein
MSKDASHHDHNQVLSEYWDHQEPFFEIVKKKGLQAYADFNLTTPLKLRNDVCVGCMDEGVPSDKCAVRMAGSGILMGVEEAAKMLKGKGITAISSHEQCGAAGIYAKQNNLSGNPDEFGKVFAKKLADEIGVPYAGHIGMNEMLRQGGMHVTRVTIYNGLKVPADLTPLKLPLAFMVNRGYMDPAAAVADAALSFKIASGDHSFGPERFKKSPYMVIALTSDDTKTGVPMAELLSELKALEKEFGGSVGVKPLIIPAKFLPL